MVLSMKKKKDPRRLPWVEDGGSDRHCDMLSAHAPHQRCLGTFYVPDREFGTCHDEAEYSAWHDA